MADYPTRRSNRFSDGYEPSEQVARPRDHASDPLAELARLIGRSEQYSAGGRADSRSPSRPAYRDPPRYRDAEPAYPDSEPADLDFQAPAPTYRSEPARDYQHYEADTPFARNERSDNRRRDVEDWGRDNRAERPDRFAPRRYEAESAHDDRETDLEQHTHEEPEFAHYADDGHTEGEEDQFYDDPPRAYRHGGLVTALALVGCAMLGTAGAYAYRSYYAPPTAAQPPPVISAADTVNKIVPPSASEAQSSKTVQDRLANAGREQIVSKQEEPVALKDIGTPTAPRVAPPPVTPSSGAGTQQQTGAVGTSSNEPKKIRTVPIRADNDLSGRATGAPIQLGPNTRAAAPTRTQPNQPLSLEGESKDQAGEQTSEAPARIRTARAPANTQRSTSSTASTSGGLMVQLSSHKSESEALASYRSLQGRFPGELGGRQGVIRRADLGAKGVFYRAMVGPFASAQEATQFCATLKSAGGTCVVPSN
jgi:sporulation related protein